MEELYRQRTADGKKTSAEEAAAMSSQLIRTGPDGFRNPEIPLKRR